MRRTLMKIQWQKIYKKNQAEARAIAQKIKNMIADQFPIFDKEIKQFRPIRYRDIVILSRAMTSAPDLEEAMKEMDIPFLCNQPARVFFSSRGRYNDFST